MARSAIDLLIVVPARGGSKRLPGKNLRALCGRSLIAHVADAVSQSGIDAPVLLSTDDASIADEGRRVGMLVPFMRPPEISGDNAATADAAIHALDWFRSARGKDPAMTMVLQPTSPLRGGACLRAAVDLLGSRSEADSVVAMEAVHLPLNKVFLADAKGVAVPVSPEEHRPVYLPNGALYLTRTAALRTQRTLYAGIILPLVLDAVRSVDVDTETDWQIAEALIAAGCAAEPAQINSLAGDGRKS